MKMTRHEQRRGFRMIANLDFEHLGRHPGRYPEIGRDRSPVVRPNVEPEQGRHRVDHGIGIERCDAHADTGAPRTACRSAAKGVTQPTMPPWAVIMRSVAALNSGK